jgi:hypothetical protein
MRERILASYVDGYRTLHALAQQEEPALPKIPDTFLRGLVGGIAELVQQCLLDSAEDEVPSVCVRSRRRSSTLPLPSSPAAARVWLRWPPLLCPQRPRNPAEAGFQLWEQPPLTSALTGTPPAVHKPTD